MEPEIKPLREAIANERTSADPPEDIAKRAEALAAKGDVTGARRERERWLAAREKRSGNPAWAFAETTSTPFDLAWSPDSKLAAIARGGDLSLYDGDLRKERERYHLGAGDAAVSWFSRRRALVVRGPGAAARVLDLDAKHIGAPLAGHEGDVTSAWASADERYVIVRGSKRITLFDAATSALVGSVSFPEDVQDLAVSASSSKLAVALEGGAVGLYELPGRTFIRELGSARGAANVYFQGDARVLVGRSGQLATFDATTGAPIGKPLENQDCDPMLLGPGAARLVWRCYAFLEAENAPGKPRLMLELPTTQAHLYTSFNGLSASPDGSRIWFSLFEEQGIVDTKTGKRIATLPGDDFGYEVMFRPDNQRIVGIKPGGAVLTTWDFKKDKRDLFAADSLASATLLGAATAQIPAETLATMKDPSRIGASPDGRVILTIAGDVATLTDTAASTKVTLVTDATDEATVVFFGSRVAALRLPSIGAVRFFQIPSGKSLGTLQTFKDTGALYRSDLGNVEPFGDAASHLSCLVAPDVEPFAACADRFVEVGLLARTLAGRGCTAEDVGDACE